MDSQNEFVAISGAPPPPDQPAAAPSSQTPGHPSFRRIPTPKRKKTTQTKVKDTDSDFDTPQDAEQSPATIVGTPVPRSVGGGLTQVREKTEVYNSSDGTPTTSMNEAVARQQATHNETYVQFMKPKFARAPIKEAGRVAYLGESSNLSLLVHDRHGNSDVVHYPLPENVRGTKARANELDNMEIDILHQRGAFLLPPRALCDELVDAFFQWIAPVVPVINRSRFMKQYRDPKNPPSLLLLQAILLAGSRVCTNPQLMDSSGSTTPAAITFYKRAKALFDANYEDDRVTIVQALILMGWYWEGPEDVTKNVFYWSRVAIVVAQGSGMHRRLVNIMRRQASILSVNSVEGSQLSRSDKRLWKRIWWTLFSRDRSVAVALGRPVGINPEDSDVEMITEDDFLEDEIDRPAEFAPDPIHVQFFINYVKLCEIMGLVLSQQYSVASKSRERHAAMDLTYSDMALADWFQHCPKEVLWERPHHHFWAALLHANYYTTLCLLHRAHMPPAGSPKVQNGYDEQTAYPSRNIAYQAAAMITSIIENLQDHDQLRYTPAFIIYSLFSALIMHVYQMRSSNKSIVSATEHRIQVCMNALKEVSKVWLVAKMVHTLFESILGNKVLEERLQKAAGKRHQKNRQPQAATAPVKPKQEAPKRKFDDMELGGFGGPPMPQVSYERSRPQTPSMTPSRELPPPQAMPQVVANTSPHLPRQNSDAFMGPSRNATRPTTPFNPSYSYPGTPPELFLVTRDSPNISQELWQNFQPDQLFPADTNISFQQYSPVLQHHPLVDPQLSRTQQDVPYHTQGLQQQQQSTPQQHHQQMPGQTHLQTPSLNGMSHLQNDHSWAHLDPMVHQQPANEETWSNSSKGGPIVPTTLNVEDWFHFFGINGEVNGLHGY
ncbi:Transcriptional activator of fatty acid utilization [Coniosporium apollinis]|uniref:Transcriptional activator of fatty acid utilization n=1 Tax=Coniosporium apollinis TaxID=61459 RepID=A0ABQ9P5C7_9PEZI|nr:Transcriptional activator of fatty acid utilization [Coniosporium apollinis]